MPVSCRETLRRIHCAFQRRLTRRYVRSVCCLFLATALIVLVITFATQDKGKTIFGTYLGADFAVFYVAGAIFDSHPHDKIYDIDLHTRSYRKLFPDVPPESQLPYANAPFFVLPFAALALLPYPWAYLVWMAISIGLYYGGLRLLLGVLDSIPKDAWSTTFLLAFSFAPFLIEGLSGGQTSAFGFFWLALALRLERQGRPLPSGTALALCAYKPTLLVLILPMLVLTRRVKTLGGFAIGASGLALLSLLAVGWQGCRNYLGTLLLFLDASTAAESGLKTWKYVDINSFARLLAGSHIFLRWALVFASTAGMFALLIRAWLKAGSDGKNRGDTVWSLTIVWTLVLNVYLGIYDTLLVVPGVLLATNVLLRGETNTKSLFVNNFAVPHPVFKASLPMTQLQNPRRSPATPAVSLNRPGQICPKSGRGPRGSYLQTSSKSFGLTSGYKYLLLLLFLIPWITQTVARFAGIQLYTLVLAAFGLYLCNLPGRILNH